MAESPKLDVVHALKRMAPFSAVMDPPSISRASLKVKVPPEPTSFPSVMVNFPSKVRSATP